MGLVHDGIQSIAFGSTSTPLIVCTLTMFKSQVANGGYFVPSDLAIE